MIEQQDGVIVLGHRSICIYRKINIPVAQQLQIPKPYKRDQNHIKERR
jgi:hypothetical protein